MSAIDLLVAAAFKYIFELLLTKLRGWVQFAEAALTTKLLYDFWDEPFVVGSLRVVRILSLILVAATLVVVIFDIAEEVSSRSMIDWGRVIANFVKGISFAYLSPYAGKLIMVTANQMVSVFRYQLESHVEGITDIGVMILYAIGFIGFIITTMMRIGSMYILCLSTPFYVPDIVRGETRAIGEWGRQVIAIGFTYVFQYILFYLGLSYVESGLAPFILGSDPLKIMMGISMWLAITQVPKLLAKFGMSSGTAGVVSTAAQTLQSAGNFLK